jgi:hypothetical protein
MTKIVPIQFINEMIDACYDSPPALEKKPGSPDRIVWRDEQYRIVEVLSEWHDYKRRGRMARNMKPEHAARAKVKGSWGVGQDYYRIKTETDRIFDIYYDRAPKDSDHRKGQWFLYRELVLKD